MYTHVYTLDRAEKTCNSFRMKTALAIVLACAALDTAFTLVWVSIGLAEEANPLMAWLMGVSDLAFIGGKMGITALCAVTLWLARDFRLARIGAHSAAAFMVCVIIYQVAFPAYLLFR